MPGEQQDKLIHREQLKGEGQVARIAKQGHLKDFPEAHIWNSIIPFWQRVKVPHLPQKAAAESGQGYDKEVPIAHGNMGEGRFTSEQIIDRVEDEYDTQPD